MNISEAVVLVTGANRGLGREFVGQVIDRGARKVYATTRRVEEFEALRAMGAPGQVEPLLIDITDNALIERAAREAGDVSILINNAGIATASNLINGDITSIKAEMDTHFWGTLMMSRAFAPVLADQGGGAIINIMSLLAFRTYPGNGAYAAAKAAQWQLTNSTRLELAAQGTQVLGAHLSSTDTDMMKAWDIPKNDPQVAVAAILDGLENGSLEVLDEQTQAVKDRMHTAPEELYADLL